jgi:hypothetical protein
MKITKEQLNQMIQEELDSYLSEFEGNEEVTSEEDDMDAPMDDMEMADAGENEELMDSLRNLYDVLKGMFDAEEMGDEMEDMEDMEEATEEEVDEEIEEVDEEIEEDTSLNESVVIDRLKQLANIRG